MVRFGIIGSGYIAQKFTEAMLYVKSGEIIAVVSKDEISAKRFAKKNGIQKIHSSVENLLEDELVDVVYVATPNHLHKGQSILALNAGKHVLCEKPFALNTDEAKKVVDLAREKNKFCMEGMWSRFIPLYEELKKFLASDKIGEVRRVEMNFGQRIAFDPDSRHYNKNMGGGGSFGYGSISNFIGSLFIW